MEKTVKLIENFCSYQGEGPNMGRAMLILRFKYCNRKCSWCDTSVKMRISAESPHTLSDIQKTIYETRSGLLITGGEPTFEKHFDDCVTLLTELDYPIANIETNGYGLVSLLEETKNIKLANFIFSPKIFSRTDLDIAISLTESILDNDNVFIKVVYEENELIVAYLSWLASQIDMTKTGKVWLMPEGTTRVDLLRNSPKVFDACEKYRFNFSSRSHIVYGFV